MAEGGDLIDFGSDKPIDPTSEDASETLNMTGPFKPSGQSTPHNVYYEQMEMQNRLQENPGGAPSYAETSFGGGESDPLIGGLKENSRTGILDITKGIPDLKFDFLDEIKEEQIKRANRYIKNRYPGYDEKKLVIGSSRKNPLVLVVKGPRGGETPIFLADGSDFQQSFLNQTYVKKALGRPAQSIIWQTSADIRERQKELNQLRQDEKRFREQKEQKEKEELDLQRRIRTEEEKSQQLQEDPDTDKKVLKQKETLLKNLKKI